MQSNPDAGAGLWNGWRISGWGLVLALWLTPLVAMQFSPQWQWGVFDFVFFAALLGGAGLALEWALRARGSLAWRLAACLTVGATLLLVYINAAVGLIGRDQDDANLLVLAVPLAGLLVAASGQFRPTGMARALLAMALVQMLVAAMVFALALAPQNQPPKYLVLSAFFAGAWLLAAWLFARSAKWVPAAPSST